MIIFKKIVGAALCGCPFREPAERPPYKSNAENLFARPGVPLRAGFRAKSRKRRRFLYIKA